MIDDIQNLVIRILINSLMFSLVGVKQPEVTSQYHSSNSQYDEFVKFTQPSKNRTSEIN